jgi:Spy/CpxP family protein refolding chaperone
VRRPVTWALGVVAMVSLAAAGSAAPRADLAARAQRILEALLVWRLVDELDLREDQIARVFPHLRALKYARIEFAERRLSAQREIQRLLGARPVDRAQVEAQLRELEAAQAEFRRKRTAALAGIRAALTVEQRARFALIQETFERDTAALLEDVRRFVEQRGGTE